MAVQGIGGWMGMDLPQATLTCLPSLAPRGKRGWKSFHGILKGMILYLQKVRGQEWVVGLAWQRELGGWRWRGQDWGRTRWAPP